MFVLKTTITVEVPMVIKVGDLEIDPSRIESIAYRPKVEGSVPLVEVSQLRNKCRIVAKESKV